jgi:WD40 repeat protein
MRIVIKWKLDKNTPISACAIDPVHDQILIGVDKTILILDSKEGTQIGKCNKHTQEVTCLGFRKDGMYFASGGKDNIVYIWNIENTAKPISKITFNDSLIQINYNPCILNVSIFIKYKNIYF